MSKDKDNVKKELTNFGIRRAITTSPAYLYGLNINGDLIPVLVEEMTVLGTQSQVSASKQKASGGNPQTVDVAYLPKGCDILVAKFNVKIMNFEIEMCNVHDVEKNIKALHEAYKNQKGYLVLGDLYAKQIANGSFLWRNKYGRNRRIIVKVNHQQEFIFDAQNQNVAELAKIIAQGLEGDLINLDIRAEVLLGEAQEVFPSQEMAEGAKTRHGSRDKSRVYYHDSEYHAMIHSQKIGNALRQIDIWHSQFEEIGAVAIEPFGTSVRRSEAYRYDFKDGFYDYLKQILEEKSLFLQNIDELVCQKDIHYFMAVLIRGGVFGLGSNKPKGKTDEQSHS